MHTSLDDREWHDFTGSRHDAARRGWTMSTLPLHRIVEGFELSQA